MEQRWSDTRIMEILDHAWDASRLSVRTRLIRVHDKFFFVVQCGVAAAVALFVAADLFGHRQPFFAPIVAIICLGMTHAQRLRRVVEVTVGVAVGVAVADVFVHLAGSGPCQVAAVVITSMSIALFLDAGNLLVIQSAVQSVAVAILVAAPGQAFTRWVDAVIGGVTALVAAMLVPQAPLRRPRVVAAKVVSTIAELLEQAAASMRSGDVEGIARTLARARDTDGLLADLRSAADEGMYIASTSPFRVGRLHGIRRVADLVVPLDRVVRSTRVLMRRVAVALGRGEALPDEYVDAVRDLAVAARVIARALSENASAEIGQANLRAVAARVADLPRTDSLSAETVLAQLRSMLVDLLQLTGLDVDDAVAAVPRERPRD